MAAVDQLAPAGRAPLHRKELFHAAVLLRVHHLPGKRRAEVVGAAGGVGDEVLSPAVDVVPPRIGKAVRHEYVELPALRLPAKDARLVAPARTVRGLGLRVVKGPFLPVKCTPRVPGKGVHRMVRIGRVEAVHDQLARVGPVVAIGVSQEHQVGHLR